MPTSSSSVPPLVSTQWLAEKLNDPNVRIIDARPTILYLSGHIENAVSAAFGSSEYMSYGTDVSKGGGVDLFSDPKSPIANQDGTPAMIREVLGQKLGIRRDSTVVVYSDGADSLAARLWWTLEHMGHKNICMLDGGFDKWLEEGLKVADKVPEIKPVEYGPGELDQSCLVDTSWVVEHCADPEVRIVFGLPFGSYYSQDNPGPREGHIPGSICIPVSRHFTPDGTWKSADELRKMYQDSGVTPDKTVVSYCLNGPGATANFFALRHILGYPRASVYLPSLVGWCADPRNLPLETYGEPRLLKEPQWVFYWGQRAQSMMHDTFVRVVDARPSADYKEGHIPYALNLFAGSIPLSGDGIPRASEIIKMLGDIGISANDKVVVYDQNNGLQAAWLLWVLEYLGHREVSLLNGGFDRWKAAGRKVSTDAPVISKSKPERIFDISICQTSFQASVRPDKVATRDWINGHGKDPDSLLLNAGASSGAADNAAPEVKNVPWSGNVTETGVFKTAAQLADIYFKAGIQPFKEIICYSDRPLEAAHAYFTLRLLGFPRIRLCPKL